MVSRQQIRIGLVAVLGLGWAAPAGAAGWIGLELADGTRGVKIRNVVPGSPAQKAGLAAGEEVLTCNEVMTPNPKALIDCVAQTGIGNIARLKLLKDEKERAVNMTVELRPSRQKLQREALVGKPAPDFAATVQAGDTIGKGGKLSELRGQVVLLDFFATWCGPCLAMMPHIEQLHERFGKKGLRVVGISSEAGPVVAQAKDRFRLKYSLIADEDESISARYQVYALPTMVIIDRKGNIKEVSVSDPELADAAIMAALREVPAPTPAP